MKRRTPEDEAIKALDQLIADICEVHYRSGIADGCERMERDYIRSGSTPGEARERIRRYASGYRATVVTTIRHLIKQGYLQI